MNAHIRVYRRLVSCYPRRFTDEYAQDLAIVFALQLRELGPVRCWLRTLRDLGSTVPTQHLEVHMKRHMKQRAATTISTICLAFAIGSLVLALVLGTSMYALLMLIVCAAAVALAVLSRKAAKPALALEASRSWKKFLIAGGALLTAVIVAINLPANKNDELSELGWSVMMLVFLLSFSLIGAGVVLAATRFSRKHQSQKHVG